MLLALGYGMVITLMALIMTKRMSALVALALVPIVYGLIAAASASPTGSLLDGNQHSYACLMS